MNTTTINIVILFLILILPIAWVIISRSKKKKLFLKPLIALAEKNNSEISEHDIWNNSVIGIDKNTFKLFFVRNSNNRHVQQELNLAEIQTCKFINTNRTANTPEGKQNVIEKLELILSYDNKNKSEVSLEFYNSKYDNLTLQEEFPLVNKWAEIINTALLNVKSKK